MRRLAITVSTRPKPRAPSNWTSIALLSLVGVVACLSAMAAFIQFKDGHTKGSSPVRQIVSDMQTN